jgi:hypothetical protein
MTTHGWVAKRKYYHVCNRRFFIAILGAAHLLSTFGISVKKLIYKTIVLA